MFTGIVQTSAEIQTIDDRPGLRRFGIDLTDVLQEPVKRGASVAVDGVCLTVTEQEGAQVFFDVMAESLEKTTLGRLNVGDLVHIERSAKLNDEIGGHRVSGHVNMCAELVGVRTPEHNHVMKYRVPKEAMPYLFEKGFVGLKGCSLTLVDLDEEARTFEVWLIPETLEITTFGKLSLGDQVNLELDPQTVAIVDTVNRTLSKHPALEALLNASMT